jgi:hypothetical protein
VILHTVLFRLRRPVDDEARRQLVAALESFAAIAPHTSGPAAVLTNLQLREDNPRVADAAMQVTLPDAEAFQAYLAAPEHVALAKDVLAPLCEGWWSIQSQATLQ